MAKWNILFLLLPRRVGGDTGLQGGGLQQVLYAAESCGIAFCGQNRGLRIVEIGCDICAGGVSSALSRLRDGAVAIGLVPDLLSEPILWCSGSGWYFRALIGLCCRVKLISPSWNSVQSGSGANNDLAVLCGCRLGTSFQSLGERLRTFWGTRPATGSYVTGHKKYPVRETTCSTQVVSTATWLGTTGQYWKIPERGVRLANA